MPKPSKRDVATPASVTVLPADCPRVSVVIPTKNEARNIPWVLERLPLGVFEVIVVDGASVDGTVEVARSIRDDIVVVDQTRSGKGNALACGFAAARGEIIVMIDADGSMDPAEIVSFVDELLTGADYVKGTRFSLGGGSSDITRIRRAGNAALNGLVNMLYKASFTDLCYGYNAFWAHAVKHLELPTPSGHEPQTGDGFEVETMMNIRAAVAPLVVQEVASYESDRLHGASNLHAVRDGLRVLRVIAKEYRTPAARAVRATPRSARPATRPAARHLPAMRQAPAFPPRQHAAEPGDSTILPTRVGGAW
ncbi:glycosyl transferase family 2 [Couchioplanes caeruleus]|uniref:Glycosyl transferase family 2 n=1 Tax=Couchioplanes caeruleus TaxID=56438 RepID=A0A3N1GPD9_9ACTN|nr:glycosyltransferase family 2 protein [Couchioplanes caeruleus]ROP32068.1 glycosyl transferase family 2 [Couchioplanes caeruleus]